VRGIAEVRLEELGEHSWLQALFNTVTGSFGSAQLRFVACPPGEIHRPADHVLTGASFPVLRAQDLDDLSEPNAWIEIARERLRELDQRLVSAGWEREASSGRHWWSRTYRRDF
jgi:hypothetical protein